MSAPVGSVGEVGFLTDVVEIELACFGCVAGIVVPVALQGGKPAGIAQGGENLGHAAACRAVGQIVFGLLQTFVGIGNLCHLAFFLGKVDGLTQDGHVDGLCLGYGFFQFGEHLLLSFVRCGLGNGLTFADGLLQVVPQNSCDSLLPDGFGGSNLLVDFGYQAFHHHILDLQAQDVDGIGLGFEVDGSVGIDGHALVVGHDGLGVVECVFIGIVGTVHHFGRTRYGASVVEREVNGVGGSIGIDHLHEEVARLVVDV